MYTHPIRKSPKSFKLYLEWGVALALVILVALVIYAAVANRTVQTTTRSVAPAVVIDVEKLNAMDNSDAHDRGNQPVKAPALWEMDNTDAHDRGPQPLTPGNTIDNSDAHDRGDHP